jgi:hypothetical protein
LFSQANTEKNDQIWKRHFFDLGIIGGSSICSWLGYTGNANIYYGYFGGLIGGSIAYQYAFSPYFAFGPGMSGFGSIHPGFITSTANIGKNITSYQYVNQASGIFSGGALMFNFMFGDLKYKKLLFYLISEAGGLVQLISACITTEFFINWVIN